MATAHVGPGASLANALTRADKKALTSFALAATLVATFPVALAGYAHTRPLSEATCVSRGEVYAGSWAEVQDCYNVGVRVSHTVTPVPALEG